MERLAAYVVRTRDLVQHEGLPIGLALGRALPALRFPKDSTLFDRIREGRRTHKSAWKSEFNRIYRKNACFLQKQTTSQLLLSEDDLRNSFEKVRDEIPEDIHPTIEAFIDAPSGWNQAAEALADCEWEDVRPIFDGLRRVKLNLGEATVAFYDERSPELLSEDNQEYLQLLAKRPKANDPIDDDHAFYESHRNEIKEDRKLRSAWDNFIFGRPRECNDFVVGLAVSIESLFNQSAGAKKRTLQIRCDSATRKDLRGLNINAGEYFAQRYAGLQSLLGKRVKWQVGKLFYFPDLVREWRKSSKIRLNRPLDFLARLRIGILADKAPALDPKDGCPHDISFSQDVIARHSQLEWYREAYKPVPLEELVPPRWSRRRPAAKDDLKSVVYLCCPVQSREGWAFLTAATTHPQLVG